MKTVFKKSLAALLLASLPTLGPDASFAAENAPIEGTSCTLRISLYDPVGMVRTSTSEQIRALAEARGYRVVEYTSAAPSQLQENAEFTLRAWSGVYCILREPGNAFQEAAALLADLITPATPQITFSQGDKPVSHHEGRTLPLNAGKRLLRLLEAYLPPCQLGS